jgi:amino acid transporter
LAYVATAVVSADTAIQYLNFILDNHANHFQVNPLWATICLLGLFGLLNMIGIGESAVVAFGIFAMHVTVLTILAVAGCVNLFQGHWDILKYNWALPPNINTGADIFLGFCVAMLGVTYASSPLSFLCVVLN